jgi:hypothetical protein
MKKTVGDKGDTPKFYSEAKRDGFGPRMSREPIDKVNRISLSPDQARKKKVMDRGHSSAMFLLEGEGRINNMKRDLNEMHDLSAEWFQAKNRVVKEKCENMYIHGGELF